VNLHKSEFDSTLELEFCDPACSGVTSMRMRVEGAKQELSHTGGDYKLQFSQLNEVIKISHMNGKHVYD